MPERLFKTEDDTRAYWNDLARKALVGRTIKEARYMTQDEADMMGWYERSIILFFDDGSWVVPQRDDEGNGGGALAISGEPQVLPVI